VTSHCLSYKGDFQEKFVPFDLYGARRPTRETGNKLALIEHSRPRAYELYESRGKEAATIWTIGSLQQVIRHMGKGKPH
jgi:hypothetical protein